MSALTPKGGFVLCAACVAALAMSPFAFAQIFEHPGTEEARIDPAAARRVEVKRDAAVLLPIGPFYEIALPLTAGKPGDLIRSERAQDLHLSPGVSAVRILYRSLSPAKSEVPASAVVLIPRGEAPAHGWPVIAWAHGTTGVTRPCAPSLMKDLNYGWSELSSLVDMGYAVVAADYQGLGAPGVHPYLDKVTNAEDVIFSVLAARRAVPTLGSRWVAMGHSQGGLVAASVAEIEFRRKDSGYLGAVSIAAAWDAAKVLGRMDAPGSDPLNNAYLALVARGLTALNPSFKLDEVLTPTAIQRLEDAGDHCVEADMAFFFDLPQGSVVKPGWQQNATVKAFFERDRLTGPVQGPMLVLASTDDESVPASTVDDNVARLCAEGARLEYVRYADYGLDHDGIERATTGMRLRWIGERFAGRPAPSNCSNFAKN
jgi:alpha-beta hydrolase superfamily lysophospholipase